MQRPTRAISHATLLAALALAGCSGSSASAPAAISFKSPALVGSSLPARYTCDGQDISPPLEWGSVPSGTREITLAMIGLTPGSSGRYKQSIEWVVAGVNPALHSLAAGEVPAGAHVALTDAGKSQPYSLCPPRRQKKIYQFAVYAIPPSITIPARFVGTKLLDVIASTGSKYIADGGGSFIATYKRASHSGARAAG